MEWFPSLLSNAILVLLLTFLLDLAKKYPAWRKERIDRLNGTFIENRRLDLDEDERMEARQTRQFESLERQLNEAAEERLIFTRQQKENTDAIRRLQEETDNLRRTHEREIAEINLKLINADLIAAQYERDIKFILDEVGIAYWEADSNGLVTATNQTFLDLSGLTPAECQGDGWMDAICPNDREQVRHQWLSFIRNVDTQRPMSFTFCNKLNGKETKVRALGKAIYLEKQVVYKYTVRTRTVFRVEG